MSDLCPQCGNPAYLPSDQCDVIWHTGAKPFGTSVVQDIEAQLAEQIEWVKSLADDLIAAEEREARLKEKLAKAVEAFTRIDFAVTNEKDPDTGFWIECSISEFTAGIVHATLEELTGDKDE